MDTNANTTISFANIIILGLTSGFFAGLISSIVNLITSYLNRKHERMVEAEKYQHSINDYRYKEIHKYLKDVCEIPNKDYAVQSKDKMMKLVEASNDEEERIVSIYRMSLPLLDKSLQEPLETVRNDIDAISKALVVYAYEDKESDYGVDDLILKRDEFRIKLIEALQKQLVVLLTHSTDALK